MKKREYTHKETQGFTIIELIIVFVIISILSALLIGNYREFEKRAVLDNLTQDVALSIRLAQSYGLNVRSDTGTFQTSYGIRFERGSNSYFIFTDPNRSVGGFTYNPGTGGAQVGTPFTLNNNYTISEVCAIRPSGLGSHCFSGTMTFIDIVYDRPDPDSNFTSNLGVPYESVEITIRNPNGRTQTVTVLATGFISIQ